MSPDDLSTIPSETNNVSGVEYLNNFKYFSKIISFLLLGNSSILSYMDIQSNILCDELPDNEKIFSAKKNISCSPVYTSIYDKCFLKSPKVRKSMQIHCSQNMMRVFTIDFSSYTTLNRINSKKTRNLK